ncbi:MAG: hypothetical protein DWI25_00215 [Planctomycetota bacterium]|nr:MAG: hypothetical protein DWI25_00215 [Planctomycetota bacterium]
MEVSMFNVQEKWALVSRLFYRLNNRLRYAGVGLLLASVFSLISAPLVAAERCNGKCSSGGCPAHCPVRPSSYGFYSTQWRVWPGQTGVQTVSYEAATPVSPPKSAVPTIAEESLQPPEPDSPLETSQEPKAPAPPTQPAPDLPAKNTSEIQEPQLQQPSPDQPRPADPKPAEQGPDQLKPVEPKPVEPKPVETDIDNLFDEAESGRKRRELLVVLQQRTAQQQTARRHALAQDVRTVSFGQPLTGVEEVRKASTEKNSVAKEPRLLGSRDKAKNGNPLR